MAVDPLRALLHTPHLAPEHKKKENRYFDASSTLGIWHIWVFTQFHPFSPLFTLFHTLLGCTLKGFHLFVLFLDTTVWIDEAMGEPQAQCAPSATIWVSGRTRDPYFEILGAPRGIMVTPSGGFARCSTFGSRHGKA